MTAGLALKKYGVLDAVRGPEIVAWNAIIFGIDALKLSVRNPIRKL